MAKLFCCGPPATTVGRARRPREFLDEGLRKFHLLVALPLQAADDRPLVAGGIGGQGTGGQFGERVAELRIDPPLVHRAGEIGAFLGAVLAPAEGIYTRSSHSKSAEIDMIIAVRRAWLHTSSKS